MSESHYFDIKQEQAGINDLNKFGVTNLIDMLAGGDVLKWDSVLKLEYSVAWLKIRMVLANNKFQRNYNKVLNEKTKRK